MVRLVARYVGDCISDIEIYSVILSLLSNILGFLINFPGFSLDYFEKALKNGQI